MRLNRKRHPPEDVVAKRFRHGQSATLVHGSECHLCDPMYGVPLPPSPSDLPLRDRPGHQISDFPPNSPDRALRFTAIRASERFRGRVAVPALSGPLPRSAITNASARNARHGAPRGPIRPRCQSTKKPASTSRRALNSPIEPASNGGRVACASPSHNPSLMRFSRSRSVSSTWSNIGGSVRYISRIAS